MSSITHEQREEIRRTKAENRARQEAMNAEQRKRERRVELLLVRAPEDPRENEPAFQQELRSFAASLRSTGMTHSQWGMTFDAVDGGGYALGHFAIAVVPAVIAAAAAVCGAWVTARYGRKVRLKIGDVEAEGRTVEEIERLLKQASEFQSAARANRDDT
jgi:hypothetical protein